MKKRKCYSSITLVFIIFPLLLNFKGTTMEYTINPDGTINTNTGDSEFKRKLQEITGDIKLDPEMVERNSGYDTHKLFK